jgi:hypothetical protein
MLSIMSLEEDENPSKLVQEEDCFDEEPATRRNMPITSVGEVDCCKDYAAMTTLDYSTVGGNNRIKRGCLIAYSMVSGTRAPCGTLLQRTRRRGT